ncbi:hypothetical protein T4D_5117 [Trichinella pseudospiralis]|uniref:Uncharacterized protein n=1 Tax=Trichinella pseudospiralis TaxID=6337 RepID=A0A0V1FHA0_TRIPS|nr:hypothetical protein T4D_5117 [Trichinella pseudospiralis]
MRGKEFDDDDSTSKAANNSSINNENNVEEISDQEFKIITKEFKLKLTGGSFHLDEFWKIAKLSLWKRGFFTSDDLSIRSRKQTRRRIADPAGYSVAEKDEHGQPPAEAITTVYRLFEMGKFSSTDDYDFSETST